MDKKGIHIAALFICILLAQVLICNHIVLFGVAVPLIIVYFIIRMPIDMNVSLLLTLSFLLGLLTDICGDTIGVNALACTITAALRRPAFYAYVQHDDRMNQVTPDVMTLGIGTYCKYMLTLVALYAVLIFSKEYFSFADVKQITVLSAWSSALTFLLILGLDSIITVRRDRH